MSMVRCVDSGPLLRYHRCKGPSFLNASEQFCDRPGWLATKKCLDRTKKSVIDKKGHKMTLIEKLLKLFSTHHICSTCSSSSSSLSSPPSDTNSSLSFSSTTSNCADLTFLANSTAVMAARWTTASLIDYNKQINYSSNVSGIIGKRISWCC